jgi:hypothetical protein
MICIPLTSPYEQNESRRLPSRTALNCAESYGFAPSTIGRVADPCFREAGAGGSNPLTPTIQKLNQIRYL